MKIHLTSLGCAKNLVDSEWLAGRLKKVGFAFAERPSEAEVLLVNTCGFIGAATQESIETILELAEYKRLGRCQRLVVLGCLGQRYREELHRALPEVDAFFGVEEQGAIVDFLVRDLRPSWRAGLGDDLLVRHRLEPGPSAFLKIAEGCSRRCRFCVIPAIRGAHRSRPVEPILDEARQLVSTGAREICIVSQDTLYYGRDQGLRDGLLQLLEGLEQIEGLAWVRLHYLFPSSLSAEFLERLWQFQKIVPYLDIPVQHGSDRILRAMGRPDTRKSLLRLFETARALRPDVTLRSTVIVGYPGEGEAEFAELQEFLEEARFDYLGLFTYSDEDQAASSRLDGKVPPELAAERQEELVEQQREISRQRMERFQGETLSVLIEQLIGPGLALGRTAHQAPEVDGQTYVRGCDDCRPGDLVEVRVQQTLDYDLEAEIVGSSGKEPLGRETDGSEWKWSSLVRGGPLRGRSQPEVGPSGP